MSHDGGLLYHLDAAKSLEVGGVAITSEFSIIGFARIVLELTKLEVFIDDGDVKRKCLLRRWGQKRICGRRVRGGGLPGGSLFPRPIVRPFSLSVIAALFSQTWLMQATGIVKLF